MKVDLFKAVADVAEVMQFENWLRFYFVKDEDGTLYLRVPEQAQERITEKYPHLAPLMEEVKDTAVTYESSMNSVCEFVARNLDGEKFPMGTVSQIFGTPEFQTEMQLFNLWAQAHEDQLDQAFLDFAMWSELFQKWKSSEEVRQLLKEHGKTMPNVVSCDNTTTH